MEPQFLAADVDQDHLVHAVVIVRIIGRVVEITPDLAGIRIEYQVAVGEQVVTEAHVAVEVGTRVANRPVQRVGLLVVSTGNPGGTATIFPGFAGPRIVSRFAGSGDGVGLPDGSASVGVDSRKPAAHAILRTRGA